MSHSTAPPLEVEDPCALDIEFARLLPLICRAVIGSNAQGRLSEEEIYAFLASVNEQASLTVSPFASLQDEGFQKFVVSHLSETLTSSCFLSGAPLLSLENDVGLDPSSNSYVAANYLLALSIKRYEMLGIPLPEKFAEPRY